MTKIESLNIERIYQPQKKLIPARIKSIVRHILSLQYRQLADKQQINFLDESVFSTQIRKRSLPYNSRQRNSR